MSVRMKGDGPFRRVFRFFIYAVALIILIYCGTAAYHFGLRIFSDQVMEDYPGHDYTIEIKEGTSIKQVGEELEKYGIIEDSLVFYIQSIIFEADDPVAGSYIFNTSQTGEELLEVIAAGPIEVETKE